MKKILLAFACLLSICTYVTAADGSENKIRIQLEVSAEEVAPLGLKVQTLQSEIMTKLIKANIGIQDDPKHPLLLLRIKSIEIDSNIATFIQLAFFEEAQLKRSNSEVMAMTWSQATLITTAKHDFSAETIKSILGMLDSFIKEYKKVYEAEAPPVTIPPINPTR